MNQDDKINQNKLTENEINFINATYDGPMVNVSFNRDESPKLYAYKTHFTDLKPGDEVLVQVNLVSKKVTIIEVGNMDTIDCPLNTQYKWIQAKIQYDNEGLETAICAEMQQLTDYRKMLRSRIREQARAAIADQLSLNFTNREIK